MGSVMYAIFLAAAFGIPAAAAVFVAFCIVKGGISVSYLKFSGAFALWIAGGVVFSEVLIATMGARGEKAGGIAVAVYVVLSALVYLIARKEGQE